MLSKHEKEQFLFKGCENEDEINAMKEWIASVGVEKAYEKIIEFFDEPNDWIIDKAI